MAEDLGLALPPPPSSIERKRCLPVARPCGHGSRIGLEKPARSGRKRIDRLTLPAAIMMIDAVALIMPEEEASANEIRHRAAHVRFARYADTQTHLAVDRALGFSRIGRKGPLPCQFAANAFLKSLPPRIPVAVEDMS